MKFCMKFWLQWVEYLCFKMSVCIAPCLLCLLPGYIHVIAVCTEIKEVQLICRVLRDFSKWKQLGTELRISHAKMDMIETDNTDTEIRKQVPYIGKFSKGGNFRIFRIRSPYAKIKTSKILSV